jgi:hypothetical protein
MFTEMILGHLVGDYLLQNRAMTFGKLKNGWAGIYWCTLHCLIYTASVCLFLWTIEPLIVWFIFLSHWPIDHWSLASKWLKLIRGRDFVKAYQSTEEYHEIDLAFSCFVYVAVDNTWHLILLWLISKFIV